MYKLCFELLVPFHYISVHFCTYTVEYVTFYSYAIHVLLDDGEQTRNWEKRKGAANRFLWMLYSIKYGAWSTNSNWLVDFRIFNCMNWLNMWYGNILQIHVNHMFYGVFMCVCMNAILYLCLRKICACDLTRVNVYVHELLLFARFIFGTKEIYIYLIIFRFDFYQLMNRMNITNYTDSWLHAMRMISIAEGKKQLFCKVFLPTSK